MGDETRLTVNLTVHPVETELNRSSSLTASAHLTQLPWKSEEERAPFIAQCNYCHQVGNSLTRGRRDATSWEKSIEKMEGYMAIVTDEQVERFGVVLAAGFDGEPIDVVQTHDASPELADAKIDLFNLPSGIDIHPRDGGVWYAKL